MLAGRKRFGKSERSTSNLPPESILSNDNEELLFAAESNPLMIPVILQTLFEFCDLSDLRKHRVVCKEWYSASEARIRGKMMVKITNGQRGRPWLDSHSPLNWSNYLTTLDTDGAPFRCFRITGINLMTSPAQSTEPRKCNYRTAELAEETKTSVEQICKNMEQFWIEHGLFLHKLHMFRVTVFSEKAFKRALFERTPHLQELKMDKLRILAEPTSLNSNMEMAEMGSIQLNLMSFSVRFYQKSNPLPFEWKRIFLQFPNIQKLELYRVCQAAINALYDVCDSVDTIRINELALTGLTCEQARSPQLQNLLQLPKLQLSKLEMDVTSCFEEERSILQVALRTHGTTLTDLVLRTSYITGYPMRGITYDALEPTNNFPFQRETLDKLTLLNLRGTVFKTFRFLEHTPNLNILSIRFQEPFSTEMLKTDLEVMMNKVRLPFLNKFEFDGLRLSEREMEALVKVMPNVEKFCGDIDTSALRIICKHWMKLRILELSMGSAIEDEAFTGIKDGSGEDTSLPNITDLTDLEELSIWNGKKIDVSSIRSAILKMPRLRYIFAFLSPKVSQATLDALCQEFAIARVHRFSFETVESRDLNTSETP